MADGLLGPYFLWLDTFALVADFFYPKLVERLLKRPLIDNSLLAFSF